MSSKHAEQKDMFFSPYIEIPFCGISTYLDRGLATSRGLLLGLLLSNSGVVAGQLVFGEEVLFVAKVSVCFYMFGMFLPVSERLVGFDSRGFWWPICLFFFLDRYIILQGLELVCLSAPNPGACICNSALFVDGFSLFVLVACCIFVFDPPPTV